MKEPWQRGMGGIGIGACGNVCKHANACSNIQICLPSRPIMSIEFGRHALLSAHNCQRIGVHITLKEPQQTETSLQVQVQEIKAIAQISVMLSFESLHGFIFA